MKKAILATLIISGVMSTSALAVDAGKGQVSFKGSIIEAPCSIAPGDESQTVELGQVSNVTLKNGGSSSAQAFSIHLEGCTLDAPTGQNDTEGKPIVYKNTVDVKFSGTEWVNGTDNTGLLKIIGEARGAGVKLMDESGDLIKVNSSSHNTFIAGDNGLNFKASLQGLAGAEVVPGEFTAVTNFTLTYN